MIKTIPTKSLTSEKDPTWLKNLPMLIQYKHVRFEVVLATSYDLEEGSVFGVVLCASDPKAVGRYHKFNPDWWEPLPSGHGIIIENP